MNRNLVYFSALLLLLGLGSGFYLLSLLGVLALVPALLSPSRTQTKRTTVQPQQQPRRIIPPQPPRPAAAEPAGLPTVQVPPPQPTQQTYPAALFPMQMFPSPYLMANPPQTSKEPATAKQEGKDELLEVGAILALLKLAFG